MQGTISSTDLPDTVWLELRLPAASIETVIFEQLCEGLGAAGQALKTDAKSGRSEHMAWFSAGDDPQKTRAAITAAAMLFGVPQSDICLNALGDDWETAWQKDWKAMPIGKHLWVRPSFCAPPVDDRLDIVLDPGMAFGTGSHATTQLCLEAIERICAGHMPATMLDMGTGSGILAIAAAKLGIKNVLAMDNSQDAVEACRKNAKINDVHIVSQLGNSPPNRRFDFVVANILAKPLINMAPELATCVHSTLVLSGLLTTQAKDVRRRYKAEGLESLRPISTQGEWAAIEMRRCPG